MHWSAYEVFSVLSGLVLIAVAMVPAVKAKDRVWSLLGGIAFVAYGWYVAGQDSGTYTFPVVIFIIPFAAILYVLFVTFGKGRADDGDRS